MSDYWLVYTSKLNTKLTFAIVRDIIAKSVVNNQKNDLTGILVFRNNMFFQALEGQPKALNALYKKLMADDRHTEQMLLYYDRAPLRLFNEWSMRSLDFDMIGKEQTEMLTLKYDLDLTSENAFPEDTEKVKAFLFDLKYLAQKYLG